MRHLKSGVFSLIPEILMHHRVIRDIESPTTEASSEPGLYFFSKVGSGKIFYNFFQLPVLATNKLCSQDTVLSAYSKFLPGVI